VVMLAILRRTVRESRAVAKRFQGRRSTMGVAMAAVQFGICHKIHD
jgi:hypothetical protein